ncbi:MAG: Gfo/Idh/MocA family oxidoreductase [Lentisphaeria bacterium]|nr:Gfo/Idh/MocA family oxidoreductase [Lentisphaeria bacterium]
MNDPQIAPVRMGLVGLRFGAGLAQRQIIGNVENEKFVRIVKVCDRIREKADAFGEKNSIPVCYDLDELLKDPEIEAVMLITPPAGRGALLKKCIDAGKHVLTTKPFELDPDEALKVLQYAREKSVIVHLNSPAPLPSCDLKQIRQWQAKYDLGRPVAAHWESYAKYNETADGSWFDSYDSCPAAPIFRLGIYGINELIAIMGKVQDVEVVTGKIATGRPTPDNAQLLLRFESGAIGSIYSSLCVGDGVYYPAGMTLHFQNGTIFKRQVRTYADNDFTHVELSLRVVENGVVKEESATFPATLRSGAYQYESFAKSVRCGYQSEETTPETIVEGIKVIAEMKKKEKPL